MSLFWLGLVLLLFVLSGLCMASGKDGRRRFLGGVAALVYFPIAVLLALTKNYK